MDDNELPRLLLEAGIATEEQAAKLAELIAQHLREQYGIKPGEPMAG